MLCRVPRPLLTTALPPAPLARCRSGAGAGAAAATGGWQGRLGSGSCPVLGVHGHGLWVKWAKSGGPAAREGGWEPREETPRWCQDLRFILSPGRAVSCACPPPLSSISTAASSLFPATAIHPILAWARSPAAQEMRGQVTAWS